jgi:hypothetical protein
MTVLQGFTESMRGEYPKGVGYRTAVLKCSETGFPGIRMNENSCTDRFSIRSTLPLLSSARFPNVPGEKISVHLDNLRQGKEDIHKNHTLVKSVMR